MYSTRYTRYLEGSLLVADHSPASEDRQSTKTLKLDQNIKYKRQTRFRAVPQNKANKKKKTAGQSRMPKYQSVIHRPSHRHHGFEHRPSAYLASKLFGRNPGRDAAYEHHLVRVCRKLLCVHIVFTAAVLYHINTILKFIINSTSFHSREKSTAEHI